ncbi:hypothetical protein F3Y22_tig00111161pilonHSYRG00006 [Hibiscus syriacus]|uniref:Calmodulin binding protein C-terminal domain-containing protein n=2 Tax=Hibiscus syriacus TaxID=106335 RepID=A0A6A2YYI2_HIBSY|nr:hypothetical protein F3Y22_tig00111161pilonHSYRG00006 [Hibiscus syriacus]
MSEKMWNVTIKHAKTCVMGNKHYVFQGSDYRIMLNPICQLIKAEINGSIYPTHKQSDVDRAYLKDLVRQAYVNWSSLEEIEGISNEIGNLIQGDHVVDQYPDHSQIMVWPSTATGDCVLPSLNQKSNPDNDQKAISEQDDNSARVCHPPPPSSSAPSSMISQLSATALPPVRLQAQSFEELAEQNQSKGNLQSQPCCCKQDPGGPAKKSVERSLDWQTTEVIHRASHNHPKSQPTKTSSLSAFSRILRAFNHLTIKIPDKSFVTYEGGKMDDDGSVLFISVADEEKLQSTMIKNFYELSDRCKVTLGVNVQKAKKRNPAKTTVFKLSATASSFREMVQSFTGMRNEAPEEIRTEIARKKAWYANLKEISGKDIHCIKQNVDGLNEADGIELIENHSS